MRLCVGIPLADGVVSEFAAAVAKMKPGAPLRWTEPESWHITLQFLGNATQEQFECLRAQLGEVRSAQVLVQLGALGCFERPGVLFADVKMTPELTALEQRVIAATSRCGFRAEERPFHPHITLARKTENDGARERGSKGKREEDRGNKHAVTLRELMAKAGSQPRFTRFTAREFLLYESHTERKGARYEVRSRFALDGC